jgi:CheY-like chemotaxis protein
LKRRIADPEQKAIAEQIWASIESLEQTFDALLDISRLDAGIVQPKTEAFGLMALIERVAGDLAPEAAAKGIDLRTRPTRLATRSDPVLVEQILRNLASNAIRYTDRGKVLIGCRARGRVVRMEVWDTGIGIAEDKRPRIFDEFYQADERDRRKGLGLGLAIVRRVASLLSINIELASTVGRGSVFRFALPRCELAASAAPRSAEPPEAVSAALGKAVVLVIDDDEPVLEAMREALRGWGVEAVTARSLACALERLPECGRYPDVIVSDYRLGEGASGIDAIKRIRHELGMAIPAMIITGDTAPKSLRVIQASGYCYLPKPVTAERLRTQLSKLLETARELPQPASIAN